MNDRAAVEETLRSALDGFERVLDAYLFGSVARGDDALRSDVDVAVFVDPRLDVRERAYLTLDLRTALIGALGRNDVDLVLLNDAGPLLYHRVLRDGARLIARDPRATTTREVQARSRWCDWQPFQARNDAIRQRHRAGAR